MCFRRFQALCSINGTPGSLSKLFKRRALGTISIAEYPWARTFEIQPVLILIELLLNNPDAQSTTDIVSHSVTRPNRHVGNVQDIMSFATLQTRGQTRSRAQVHLQAIQV